MKRYEVDFYLGIISGNIYFTQNERTFCIKENGKIIDVTGQIDFNLCEFIEKVNN